MLAFFKKVSVIISFVLGVIVAVGIFYGTMFLMFLIGMNNADHDLFGELEQASTTFLVLASIGIVVAFFIAIFCGRKTGTITHRMMLAPIKSFDKRRKRE